MPLVITPDANIPLPFDTTPEELTDFRNKAKVACKTILALAEAGEEIAVTESDKDEARKIFAKGTPGAINTSKISAGTALHLESLLSQYDFELMNSAHRLRNYVTNKLLEFTQDSDPKVSMRALENLGKIGSVGLFSDKLDITVTHKSTQDVEKEIWTHLEKYMGVVEAVEKQPDEVDLLALDLDKELGMGEYAQKNEEDDLEDGETPKYES